MYFPSLPHTDRNIDLVSFNISLNRLKCKNWTNRSDSTLSTLLRVVLLSRAVKTNRRNVGVRALLLEVSLAIYAPFMPQPPVLPNLSPAPLCASRGHCLLLLIAWISEVLQLLMDSSFSCLTDNYAAYRSFQKVDKKMTVDLQVVFNQLLRFFATSWLGQAHFCQEALTPAVPFVWNTLLSDRLVGHSFIQAFAQMSPD